MLLRARLLTCASPSMSVRRHMALHDTAGRQRPVATFPGCCASRVIVRYPHEPQMHGCWPACLDGDTCCIPSGPFYLDQLSWLSTHPSLPSSDRAASECLFKMIYMAVCRYLPSSSATTSAWSRDPALSHHRSTPRPPCCALQKLDEYFVPSGVTWIYIRAAVGAVSIVCIRCSCRR